MDKVLSFLWGVGTTLWDRVIDIAPTVLKGACEFATTVAEGFKTNPPA